MHIPDYWAEARVTGKVQGRNRVVRRFGWSEVSLAAAASASMAVVPFAGGRGAFGCSTLVGCLVLPMLLITLRQRMRNRPDTASASQRRARERVERVAREQPGGRFALYETPAGLRLLALHATYDPTAPATQRLLQDLGGDPAYARLCALQACFRARVSGKPWRMGVRGIRPRPGIWPVHPERIALREAWVAEYEAAAADHAACRYVGDLGEGPVDPRCREVQRLHDELSRARSTLPIA